MFALMGLTPLSAATLDELRRLAQDEQMTGAHLVSILQTERAEWNALLAQVGLERMEEPVAAGEWSVKEIVAHLTWYERSVVENARRVFSGGEFVRPRDRGEWAGLSMDERNELIVEQARPRPASDVLAEADDVFNQLLAVVAACPDRLLNDTTLLDLPDDIPPWMRLANNSYGHYQEHARDVRAWLQAAV
jgi:hypothetical protein